METLPEWLAHPATLLLSALVLLLVMLLPLYVQLSRQQKASKQMQRSLDRLRGMNDAVMQALGEMSRIQRQQLDAFARDIRATGEADEARLERLRLQIDERLAAYDRQMARAAQTLEEKLSANERRLSDVRQTLEGGIRHLQGENEKKLEQIRATVDEKLSATLDRRLGESFRTVSERLEQVYKGLGEMQTLAVGVGDLKKVLTGVKTRGIWGEVQLGALLEQALAPGQYVVNAAVRPGSAERVEYAVLLPGRGEGDTPVYLPIDAKFPQEDYQRLLEASDSGDRQATDAASRALEAAIRTEAKRIHDKYIAPPHTTDFAILFLPVEGLYAEALRRDGVIEGLQRTYRVVVTGPTTLLALLNSLQMGFRTVAIERRSSEVWALLGAVKAEFGKFADLLVKTQQKLRQASDSIDIAARKTRTIERRLQNVQHLAEAEAQSTLGLEEEAQPAFADTEETDDDLSNPGS